MEIEVLKQVKYRMLKGEKTQRRWREGGKLLFFSTWSRILTAHPWELVCLRSESFHAADTISARTPKPLEQKVEFCVLLTVILSLVGHVVREKALLSQVCLQLLFALFIIHAVCFSVFLFFLAEKKLFQQMCELSTCWRRMLATCLVALAFLKLLSPAAEPESKSRQWRQQSATSSSNIDSKNCVWVCLLDFQRPGKNARSALGDTTNVYKGSGNRVWG